MIYTYQLFSGCYLNPICFIEFLRIFSICGKVLAKCHAQKKELKLAQIYAAIKLVCQTRSQIINTLSENESISVCSSLV